MIRATCCFVLCGLMISTAPLRAQDKPAPNADAASKPAEAKPAENNPADAKPADGKPAEGGPLKVTVVTANDEQASGVLVGVGDGQIRIGTEPERAIALADVLRVDLGLSNGPLPAADGDLAWVGQDNHDLVQVGGASGGNGIQDIHLHATNLRAVPLKQVIVTCKLPKQLRVWRLDTSQSPHWRLAVARAELAAQAELYLEPPADDAHQQRFEVTYTYTDGVTQKSGVVGTTHTSDKLKLVRSTQAGTVSPQEAEPGKAEVILSDSGKLQGDIAAMDAESVTLTARWKGQIAVPFLQARGIWFNQANSDDALGTYQKLMTAPGGEDVVLVRATDKSVAQLQARVLGITAGKLRVNYQQADRNINFDRVLGIVFAAHPPLPRSATPIQVLYFNSGEILPGRWVGYAEGKLQFETAWNTPLQVPAEAVSQVRTRNGKLTFLTDLEPVGVEETAYFGRKILWRRDQGFDEQPPRLRGKAPGHVVAMHSRCVLTYQLDGQFDKFRTTLGFDDTAGTRGRVACRVLVDGRAEFDQKDFRANQDPVELDLSVAGAKQLVLEVDFGEGEDVGDRVLWTEPRLVRATN